MKFETYKDVVFAVFTIIWFIVDIVIWVLTKNDFVIACIINPLVLLGFAIMTVIQINHPKFKNWLNTKL